MLDLVLALYLVHLWHWVSREQLQLRQILLLLLTVT